MYLPLQQYRLETDFTFHLKSRRIPHFYFLPSASFRISRGHRSRWVYPFFSPRHRGTCLCLCLVDRRLLLVVVVHSHCCCVLVGFDRFCCQLAVSHFRQPKTEEVTRYRGCTDTTRVQKGRLPSSRGDRHSNESHYSSAQRQEGYTEILVHGAD